MPLFAITIFATACSKSEQPAPCNGALCSEPNKEDMPGSGKPALFQKAVLSAQPTGYSEGTPVAARRSGDVPTNYGPVDNEPVKPVHDTLSWKP